MYSISVSKFGRFDKFYLKNDITNEYLAIVPEYGCNVNELVLNNGIKNFEIVKGDSSPDELMINAGFKGCKLVPFPNRIKDGNYHFLGKNYQLAINDSPHALHGLVLYKKFEIINQTINKDYAAISLAYTYSSEHIGYPFDFRVEIIIRLNERGLHKKTKITNLSPTPIPMADGWHLYFHFPNISIDNLLLSLPSLKKVETDSAMIPNGVESAFSKFHHLTIIKDEKFDNCFTLDCSQELIEIKVASPQENCTINAWQKTGRNGFNYVQIYTPPNRDCIAIEPMTCIPDAFNNKTGLVVLNPNEIMETECGVQLSTLN